MSRTDAALAFLTFCGVLTLCHLAYRVWTEIIPGVIVTLGMAR